MIRKARARVADHGWNNVTVTRADATTADLGGPYDAAIATLSLSVMPDVERAVRNLFDSLAPGGRLGVLDIRPVPHGPVRLLNPLLRAFLRWYANWNPTGDVPASIEAVFGAFEEFERSMAGATYSGLARKPA